MSLSAIRSLRPRADGREGDSGRAGMSTAGTQINDDRATSNDIPVLEAGS